MCSNAVDKADLIRALVEDALQKGSERAAVASAEIYTVLKRLAVTLTNTRSDPSVVQRATDRSSRLVALSQDGAWDEERRYAMALKITRHGSLFRQSIPADDIRRRAEELLRRINPTGTRS